MTLLRLTRPIVFLDTETTGTHPEFDRIVQIGLVKVYPDGERKPWQTLVNPEVPIPPEATEIHGITDSDVVNAPTFRNVAGVLGQGLAGCDVGGFNVRFDVRMLIGEFRRVGYPLNDGLLDGAMVDACTIFHLRERHNLEAAVRRYLRQEHEDAHDALADARASLDVLEAQLAEYGDLPRTPEELHQLLFETPTPGFADPAGKLAYRYGHLTINFGKNATKRLDQVTARDLEWILRSDFSKIVKRHVSEELARRRG